MITKARETIEQYSMIPNGASVICAVSGGADSMALLSVLYTLQQELGFSLQAAHVNHCLRGAESERDEQFVREHCKANKIPLEVCRADIAALAAQRGEGVEESARHVRYAFFEELAQGETARIATAHSLNDRMETLLMNLVRGATLHGLCAIPPIRGNIIRPLITCSRAEIEQYCARQGIPYIIDSSNMGDAYTRNRVRHTLIPLLREGNPRLEDALQRCFESLECEEHYLAQQTRELLLQAQTERGYAVPLLQGAHPALRRRALASLLRSWSCNESRDAVLRLEELLKAGGKLAIGKRTYALVRRGTLSRETTWEVQPFCLPFTLGEIEIAQAVIHSSCVHQISPDTSQKIHKQGLAFLVDCDKMIGNSFFRTRQPGDSMRLLGQAHNRDVKKLFQERGITGSRRDETVFLADDGGIVWAEGLGCAERCAVGEGTKNILQITVERARPECNG